MSGRKTDHHFVPQSYLRAWGDGGTTLWVYRLLVSHPEVPPWAEKSIRGVAYHQDLYTRRSEGVDVDAFENWLDEEIETPASGPLQKVLRGDDLSPEEWTRVARFVGAQDLRTPISYLEMKERWERDLPDLLNSVLERSVRDLERGRAKTVMDDDPPFENPKGIFNVVIEPPEVPESDQGSIRAEVTVGRALWLEGIKRLLTHVAHRLSTHKWSVAEASPDTEWFTSDHPVVKLNYHSENNYDFKGGWGSHGTEIMMPLSPRFLLYTQIGKEHPSRLRFSRYQTYVVQRILAERAFRFVFTRKRMRKVEWFRPRITDRDLFLHEQRQWRDWNKDQGAVEE